MRRTVTSVSAPPPGFLTLSAVSSQARASRPSPRPSPGWITCRYRAGPLPFPFRAPPAGIAHPSRGRWLPRRSVGAAFECDPSCPDLPGLPPTPASFRPTLTRSAECYLVRPRVRQTSARWPVSLQGSSDVSSREPHLAVWAPDSSSPAGTAYRAHPRVAPSTSERSSSRVPDSLPRRRHRLVGRGPRGVLPSRALLRLRPLALTDLPGFLPQWGTERALEMRYGPGCAPSVGSAAPPCVLFWRPHDDSTCRQRRRCVVYAGPPRGDRPLPPRP